LYAIFGFATRIQADSKYSFLQREIESHRFLILLYPALDPLLAREEEDELETPSLHFLYLHSSSANHVFVFYPREQLNNHGKKKSLPRTNSVDGSTRKKISNSIYFLLRVFLGGLLSRFQQDFVTS